MKRGQVWISDYALSMLLFIAMLIIAAKLITNTNAVRHSFEENKLEAAKISEYMMGEGYPADWDNITLVKPGLMTGQRLNSTKIEEAMKITSYDYVGFKSKLQAKYDFAVIFKDKNGDVLSFSEMCHIGASMTEYVSMGPMNRCVVKLDSIEYDNLVKVERYAILDSRIIKMEVYSWS